MTEPLDPLSEAHLSLLSLANEKGKFAIELGFVLTPEMQEAFETGIDERWFTLVDVSPVAISPRRLLRIFKLTPDGVYRLAVLKARAAEVQS